MKDKRSLPSGKAEQVNQQNGRSGKFTEKFGNGQKVKIRKDTFPFWPDGAGFHLSTGEDMPSDFELTKCTVWQITMADGTLLVMLADNFHASGIAHQHKVRRRSAACRRCIHRAPAITKAADPRNQKSQHPRALGVDKSAPAPTRGDNLLHFNEGNATPLTRSLKFFNASATLSKPSVAI